MNPTEIFDELPKLKMEEWDAILHRIEGLDDLSSPEMLAAIDHADASPSHADLSAVELRQKTKACAHTAWRSRDEGGNNLILYRPLPIKRKCAFCGCGMRRETGQISWLTNEIPKTEWRREAHSVNPHLICLRSKLA